jgi:hypothetical protein
MQKFTGFLQWRGCCGVGNCVYGAYANVGEKRNEALPRALEFAGTASR